MEADNQREKMADPNYTPRPLPPAAIRYQHNFMWEMVAFLSHDLIFTSVNKRIRPTHHEFDIVHAEIPTSILGWENQLRILPLAYYHEDPPEELDDLKDWTVPILGSTPYQWATSLQFMGGYSPQIDKGLYRRIVTMREGFEDVPLIRTAAVCMSPPQSNIGVCT
eukprot:Platyproteum_vivax@DN14733_c0_g1_i1.p1